MLFFEEWERVRERGKHNPGIFLANLEKLLVFIYVVIILNLIFWYFNGKSVLVFLFPCLVWLSFMWIVI